jgi:hypothetical protein
MLRAFVVDVIRNVCKHKLCVSFAVTAVDGEDFEL